MEADRREREKREQETLKRQREQEELEAKLQLEEAVELSKKLTKENNIQKIRETLTSEPQPSGDVAAIRFQLPQGAKLARRFHRDEKTQVIFNNTCIF